MGDSCARVIKMIDELIEKRANRELQRYNLTVSQVRILTELYSAAEEMCSMKELERRFGVSQATVQGIVARLVRKRLVIGLAKPDDKRVKMVKLTDDGRQLALTAIEKLREVQEMITSSLSSDEQAVLMQLLEKVHMSMSD